MVVNMTETDESVRLGVVGLGGMGQLHADNALSVGHQVVGGCDVLEEPREQFHSQFDTPVFESHDELYERADLDAVVITTPNTFHAPAATSALEQEIDVLVEKPLADDLENAERIAGAAEAADSFCMVGFHSRFTGSARLFDAQRETGRFGDITHVEANYVRRRGIPGLGSWFTNEALSGGGSLIDIGVHAIDFAMFLADFPDVTEVSAVTRSNFGTRSDYEDPDNWAENWSTDGATFDVDDSASAFIRCADGVTISLEVSWAANREPTTEFVARGTAAGAQCVLQDDTLTIYECGTAGTDHFSNVTLQGGLDPTGHHAELAAFLEASAAGERPETNTVWEGLAVQQVIDAIYRSGEQGQAVQL